MTQQTGRLMAAEIAEQPETLQRVLDAGSGPAREAAEVLARRRPR